jgi:hypothetical protein
MSKCKDCQHEEGHSQACPKYGESISDFLMGFGKKKKIPETNEPEWARRIRELNSKIQNK